MPRIPHQLMRQAKSCHPFLPLVLREVRDLKAAKCELRWLNEHAHLLVAKKIARSSSLGRSGASATVNSLFLKLCKERSRGKPLQYLLGSQPFGGVGIICRPGVLCPRTETEATVELLSSLLKANTNGRLRIVDLCTGPGSVALLLAHNLPHISVLGVDNSTVALKIARQSLSLNTRANNLSERCDISFIHGDILSRTNDVVRHIRSHFSSRRLPSLRRTSELSTVDVVFANPPYVSARSLWRDTSRGVRLFEPVEALLPPSLPSAASVPHEDIFYPAIERMASELSARAMIVEVGDEAQAQRVKASWESQGWKAVIWKDYAGRDRNVISWRRGPESSENWSWLKTAM